METMHHEGEYIAANEASECGSDFTIHCGEGFAEELMAAYN